MWYKNEGDTRTTTTEYSEADDYLCGNAIPDLFGGFGTSVSFFGFDFGINFNYQIGGQSLRLGVRSGNERSDLDRQHRRELA